MQNIEKAIRQSFLKINANDPDMRRRVYDAVWRLYAQALAKHNCDSAILALQEEKFAQLIVKIEAEFLSLNPEQETGEPPARPAEAKEKPVNMAPNPADAPPLADFSPRAERVFFSEEPSRNDDSKQRLERETAWHSEPPLQAKNSPQDSEDLVFEPLLPLNEDRAEFYAAKPASPRPAAAKDLRPKRTKRRFWRYLLYLLWLVIGAVSLFSLYRDSFGVFYKAQKNASSHAPATLHELNDNKILRVQGWQSLWTAQNSNMVKLPADFKASVQKEKEEAYLHISPLNSNIKSRLFTLQLPSAILAKWAGKKLLFALAMRRGILPLKPNNKKAAPSDGRESYYIAIKCNFGGPNICPTHHYEVPIMRGNLLFSLVLPPALPKNSALLLEIKGAKPYALDLYALAMRPL